MPPIVVPVRALRLALPAAVIPDADVNADLINRHHHRTPVESIPTLLADDDLEAQSADGPWQTTSSTRSNHRALEPSRARTITRSSHHPPPAPLAPPALELTNLRLVALDQRIPSGPRRRHSCVQLVSVAPLEFVGLHPGLEGVGGGGGGEGRAGQEVGEDLALGG